MTTLAYEERKRRLSEIVKANRAPSLRLDKPTSNVFCDRKKTPTPTQRLDVRQFAAVLGVDRANGIIDVEGMATYDTIVAASLAHGVMPAVVPQLKSITLGGAFTGCGIESSSFRYGLVHETVLELEVLLAD